MNSDEHPQEQSDPMPDILVCKDREKGVMFVTKKIKKIMDSEPLVVTG